MNIKKWKGYKEFIDVMDNIIVGSKVMVSEDMEEDVNLIEHVVTSIEDCDVKDEAHVDELCYLCVGEIGLDGEDATCYCSDFHWDKSIGCYIRKVISEPDFLDEEEMML